VLARVRAAGIRIVGATGRGPRLTSLVRSDIPSADYLVLGGGSRVLDLSDPADPVVLRDDWLPGPVLADILTAIERVAGPLSVMVEAGDAHDSPLWGDSDESWPYPAAFEARVRAECVAGPVIKGFARQPDHHVDALLAIARDIVPAEVASITQAGLGYIEICPPGVDKATGLAVVVTALGVDPDDVLVFGDMPNDLPMFAWAGFGRVAVANAHPAVLAAADELTGSNDDDGVARFLDRMLAG
jgi:hypothetical protein